MYKSAIRSALLKIIDTLNIKELEFSVEKPADEQFGDYSTNIAMLLAKKLKRAPLEIAKEIAVDFPKLNFIENLKIEAPGFINFYLKKESLVSELAKIVNLGNAYGAKILEKPKKIVLEHTNVNPNKALHIGHLRGAVLGNACEKILELLGQNVEVEYYVDDTGVQVAVSILGIKELDVEKQVDEKYDHFMGKVYSEAVKALEKNKKLEKRKEDILKMLDEQKEPDIEFINNIIRKVVAANLETATKFGIDYDLLIWESDILKENFWKKTLEILKNNPNFCLVKSGKNKGCWVLKNAVSLQSETEENQEKVIVKSNGAATYTGKDIAYHLWKFNLLGNDFKYQKWGGKTQEKPLWSTSQEGRKMEKFGHGQVVVNFIDSRQSFPQQTVKNCLESLGYRKEAENFHHIGYGVVSLSPKTARELGMEKSEEKNQHAMSGRKGLVVLADNLLDLLLKKIKQKHPDAPNPAIIAISAIKYYMLKHNTFSDIIFDYDQALDIYGNTGPYLQYAYARGRSVLRKYKVMPSTTIGGQSAKIKNKAQSTNSQSNRYEPNTEEISLMRWLIHFPEVVSGAGKQYAPNLLCNYLFELASRFNTFYNKCPIIKAKEGKDASGLRVLLTQSASQVLKNGMNLLGIETLEKM